MLFLYKKQLRHMEPSVEFSWIFRFRLPGGGIKSVEMGWDVRSSPPRWVLWVLAATAAPVGSTSGLGPFLFLHSAAPWDGLYTQGLGVEGHICGSP